jgi:exonuclease III
MLLQETWLKVNNIINFPRFEAIRSHANGTHLGTAIFIKNTFISEQVHIPGVSCIETTAAVIQLQDNMKLLVISIYIPHAVTVSELVNELNAIKDEATKYDACIIGGDFNSRSLSWDVTSTSKGLNLERWTSENADIFSHLVPTEPTFPRSGSRIDHFLISNDLLSFNTSMRVEPTFSTHNSVTLELGLEGVIVPLIQAPPLFRDFRNVDWTSFRGEIEEELSLLNIADYKNLSREEIDHAVDLLTSVIQSNMERWIPLKEAVSDKHLLLSPQVQSLIARRRKLKKLLMRENSKVPKNKPKISQLGAAIRCWSEIIDREIQSDIRERTAKCISDINDDRNMFQKINRLTGRKRRSQIKAININSRLSSNNAEITEAFATFYRDLYTGHGTTSDPELLEIMNQERDIEERLNERTTFGRENSATNPTDTAFFSSPEEIRTIIQGFNNKKSAGPDGIPNTVIRKMPFIFCKLLAIIINNCLNSAYFPTTWKKATLIPIEKKKAATDVADFRPISMTNNMSKVLEQVILINLEAEVDPFPTHQFGFRRGHSTIDALCLLRDKIAHGFNKGETTLACFLDIRKAFDSVWTEGLRHKLRRLSIDHHIAKLIGNFLENRTATVLVNKHSSHHIPVERGVPQGTKLGPRLYNIYTADQPTPQEENMAVIQYADDTAVISTERNPLRAADALQSYLIDLEEFYNRWKISVNGSKSELVLFKPHISIRQTHAIKRGKQISVNIGGELLKPTKSVKYLGIILDDDLKFGAHIQHNIKKTKIAYGMLIPLLNHVNLSKKCKETMYKMLIRPVMLYGALVWVSSKPTSLERMAVCERKIIRRITGLYRRANKRYYSNKTLYENCNIRPFQEYLKDCVKAQKTRFREHNNELIKQLNRKVRSKGPYIRTKDINKKYLKNLFKDNPAEQGASTAPPL